LLNYAHLTVDREPETSIFWVFAGNSSRFTVDYYNIAHSLGLKGLDSPDADVLQMVKEALERRNSGPWLLLLDNIDDGNAFFNSPPAHLTDSVLKDQRSLASYLPECQHGSILFSTRDKAVALELTGQGKIILVDKLNPDDGKALLRKKLGSEQTNEDSWTDLLEEVEYLPLAIVQAASYIRQKSLTVSRYLSNYQEMATTYLNHEFRERAGEGGVTNAILKTWLITFEQIRVQDRRAADILCMMAFFHRQEVPYYLIRAEDENQPAFDHSMGTLLAFSLVTCPNEFYSYSVHNLVQLAARLWINSQLRTTVYAGLALSSVSKWYPADFQFTIKDRKWTVEESQNGHESRERCAELLVQVDPVLRYNEPNTSNITEYENLLQNCQVYLRKRHQYRLSEQYISQLVDALRSVHGESNIRTIHAMGELGYLHYCQGNYAASEAKVREALTICDSFSAPIATIEDLHRKLAWASQEQQKFAIAESLHHTVLTRRKKDLGMDSPTTLDSFDDLGYTLSRFGKHDAAKPVLEAAVAGRGRVLGPDHPKTLRSVNRLATVLRAQGDWIAAETMGRRVVEGTELALGPRAGGTVRSKGQLALTLEKLQKFDEAEVLYCEIASIKEETLDPQDVGLLRTLVQVAGFLRGRKRFVEAARMYAKAREGYEGRGGIGCEEAVSCSELWKDTVRDMNEEDSESEESEDGFHLVN
jgi:tetratricopeptide (TPR) repeat protein